MEERSQRKRDKKSARFRRGENNLKKPYKKEKKVCAEHGKGVKNQELKSRLGTKARKVCTLKRHLGKCLNHRKSAVESGGKQNELYLETVYHKDHQQAA